MKKCFECNRPSTENYMPIPKTLGGNKAVPYCEFHIGLIYDPRSEWKIRTIQSQRIREGLRRTVENGIKLGRPKKNLIEPEVRKRMADLRADGNSYRAIEAILNIPRQIIWRCLHDQ